MIRWRRGDAVAPGLIATGLHAAAGAPDRLARLAPAIPQPDPWVRATTPSRLGYSARSSEPSPNWAATMRATVAEQLTEVRIPM